MNEFFLVMGWPILVCLVLAGIHTYLGFHVLERQVIFVDLALAQIAVLGASFAFVAGYGFDSPPAYWLSLGFTVIGAAVFALTRFKEQRIPQEAVIGIVYVVSAALLMIVLSRSGEGDEHIRQALAGNILLVTPFEIAKISLVYVAVGIFHFIFRRQFFAVSQGSETALAKGVNVRWWDFLFYVSFGLVVTSSVKVAGVLLVFCLLVVPAVCAMLFSETTGSRLAIGWGVGFGASVAGMAVSYSFDLPVTSSVVCALGAMLVILGGIRRFVLR